MGAVVFATLVEGSASLMRAFLCSGSLCAVLMYPGAEMTKRRSISKQMPDATNITIWR